jgi:hypothetical protein
MLAQVQLGRGQVRCRADNQSGLLPAPPRPWETFRPAIATDVMDLRSRDWERAASESDGKLRRNLAQAVVRPWRPRGS